ncbi:MAG: spermidine/putrescine ABC transporter substrate-binding protein [Gaiellaceae bacterium]
MSDAMTRRQLIERGAILSLPALLAACGGGGISGAQRTTTGAAADRTLRSPLVISNWPLYIDIDEDTKKRPTIQQFQQKYDVAVRYIEDVNDNDEFFAKIQPSLSAGQSVDRDLIVLTDWMAGRLVRLGWLEPIDREATPNASNLVDALASPGWDPDRTYSLPWQSGMTGIAYNPDLTGGKVDTIEQLLTDPALKGKVTLLTEMPDTVGLVMLSNGDDPSSVEAGAFSKAIDTMQKAVDAGQIRQFTGNDYSGMLAKGDVAAAVAWSGDVVQLQADNPNLEFTLPTTGGMIWTDNMLIPKGGHVYTSSTFMNFVYDPAIAAQIEAYVNYICPVKGAREVLLAQDPDIAGNELIFPSDETLAQVHIYDAEAADNQDYKEQFQALIGA